MQSEDFVSPADLIGASARRFPQEVAIRAADLKLTYAELEANAQRLAVHMRSRGIGNESKVAIGIGRNVLFPIAVLAALRCGACHIPLNSRLPAAYLQRIISETQVDLAIVDQEFLRTVDIAFHTSITLSTDQVFSTSSVESEENWSIHPTDPAYIVYTSGSTRNPRGVVICHGSLSQYMTSLGKALALVPKKYYVHSTSFGFSAAVRQLLLPLATGMQVIMAPGPLVEPRDLHDLLPEESGFVLDLTPSMYRALLSDSERWKESPLSKLSPDLLLSFSEPLPVRLARRILEFAGDHGRAYNMYGQTETTGTVSLAKLDTTGEASIVSIGKAIDGMSLQVLDERLKPCPVGIAGQLCISGGQLARGYLSSPELTSEKFIPSPLDQVKRLYRSGDIAALQEDGSFQFLGRSDHQYKINGGRIRIEEIEAAIASLEGIKSTAVRVDSHLGNTTLSAYVVATGANTASRDSVIRSLQEALPSYMIPSTITFMESLPVTENGKLDRRALPVLGKTERQCNEPRSMTFFEEELAKVWSDIFGLTSVGLQDNFFGLGGNSLLAIKMVARVKERLGISLSLMSIPRLQTLSLMANHIDLLAQQQ